MVKIELIYNPYLVKTELRIDGKELSRKSPLYIEEGVRLQEWVEEFPARVEKEFRDTFFVDFIGTETDYEDLQNVCSKCGAKSKHKKIKVDVNEAEQKIVRIFNEIQNGPIEELKNESITSAFEAASSSTFEVNVIATMSAGKSTLINSMLGRRLMPAAAEATTATIVRIKDVDERNCFIASAFDEQGKELYNSNDVSLKEMKEWNAKERVQRIEMEGDIPFVSSEGMSLILVDTPGPNNSRDKHHQELTFKMLEDSEKSLVLFVLNGRQLGITDEKSLLDFICETMRKGGKKTRDRYLFVVNQVDALDPRPEADEPGCVKRMLMSVQNTLNEYGIKNANIFPISAGAALEMRIKDDEEAVLHPFRNKIKKYDEMKLHDYYDFTHLPVSSRNRIEAEMNTLDEEGKIEYYSGIKSVEEAIRQYVNKYARTTKVCDLVLSFNNTLNQLATLAKLEDDIRKDAKKGEEFRKQIEETKRILDKSDITKKMTNEIDNSDYTSKVKEEIKDYLDQSCRQFLREIRCYENTKEEKNKAEKQFDDITKTYNASISKINVTVNTMVRKSFSSIMSNILKTYMSQLSEIGISSQNLCVNTYSSGDFNSAQVACNLKAFERIIDEGYMINEEYQTKVGSTKGRNCGIGAGGGLAAGAVAGAAIGGPLGAAIGAGVGAIFGGMFGRNTGHEEYYETRYRPKYIEKWGTYIDMAQVVSKFQLAFANDVAEKQLKAIEYIDKECFNIKKEVKCKLKDVENKIQENMNRQLALTENKEQTEKEMQVKEQQLKWLLDIQGQVNEIVAF